MTKDESKFRKAVEEAEGALMRYEGDNADMADTVRQVFKDAFGEAIDVYVLLAGSSIRFSEVALAEPQEVFRRVQHEEVWPGKEPGSGLQERGDTPVDPPFQGYAGRLPKTAKPKAERDPKTPRGKKERKKREPNTNHTLAPASDMAVGRMVRLIDRISGGTLEPPARLEAWERFERSRMVTGKKTEIVINTNFPLYAEFKGSEGYLAETIIMKVAEPGEGESRTVTDYVAEVTNMTAVWADVHRG